MKKAILYRMALPHHLCPYGLKALDLLKRRGYEVDDRVLTTRGETDAFKAEHDVSTTPQIFIDGTRIGGYSELRAFFGNPLPDPKKPSYTPVIAVFAMAFFMAAAGIYALGLDIISMKTAEWFVAFSMCMLAVQKFRDLESFATGFLNYDILARRYVPYAKFYPFAEALAGILMIAGTAMWLAVPLMLLIGTVGAVSIIKAVYIDKRELKCACVGGHSNVPLGFVSLLENLLMIALAVWMIFA